MTLRTVTYDDSTHKIVPLEPTIEMKLAFEVGMSMLLGNDESLKLAIAVAPEYQEPENQIAKQAERYEKIRKLSAHQFNELYWKNIHEGIHFDFLVDELGKDE